MTNEDLPVIGRLGDHALRYAEQGMEVFAVDASTKRPMKTVVGDGPSQYDATTDPELIAEWWERWPTALIGHRLAADHVILDIDPRHGGQEVWQAIRTELGLPAPTTRAHLSGRGEGGHIWYRRPENMELVEAGITEWARDHRVGTEGERGQWLSGIDLLQRMHRYTILPPSPHPETGAPYRWHTWGEVEDMPVELALLMEKPPPPPERERSLDPDSIADWFTDNHSVDEILERHGWSRVGSRGWRHPEATNQLSATVRYDCLFCYSSTPGLPVTSPGDANGLTPFRLWAELEWRGDLARAALEARELKDGPRPTSPPPWATQDESAANAVELEVAWADEVADDPPEPLDWVVNDLVAVGELTVLGAPRAMGKTWAGMGIAAVIVEGDGKVMGHFDVLDGGPVLYLQGELTIHSSAQRWRLLRPQGVPRVGEVFDVPRLRVHEREVRGQWEEERWTDRSTVASIDPRLEPTLEANGVRVLIVDPWATFFAGNENSNDEVEQGVSALVSMARRVGCAVFVVHHISAKTQHAKLAEPEDLWRGATRLADAAATRITLLPHYTTTEAAKEGLDRFEARRYGDLHVLNRNGPSPGVLHVQRHGYEWVDWTPESHQVEVESNELTLKKLARIIEGLGTAPVAEIASVVGRSERVVSGMIAKLEGTGAIQAVSLPTGRKGYRLV